MHRFRFFILLFVFLFLIVPVFADSDTDSDTAVVPILMYHHFTADPTHANGNCITADAFAAQLAALSTAGYHSVTVADCVRFVDSGMPLPANPVLLTADDGYKSVLELALPIVDRYDFSLTVAVMGMHSIQDTDAISHFTMAEALSHPLANRLELISHTYNLHDADGMGVPGKLTLLPHDIDLMRGLSGSANTEIERVFAYPFGKWNRESERILRAAGYRATLAIRAGAYSVAVLQYGKPESLYTMPRIAVDDSIDGAELTRILTQEVKKAGKDVSEWEA